MKTAKLIISQQQARMIAQALKKMKPEELTLPMEPISNSMGRPSYDVVEELESLTDMFEALPQQMDDDAEFPSFRDPDLAFSFVD